MSWLLYPWGENCQYQFSKRLGGPQSEVGCFGEEKKTLAPAEIGTLDHPAQSLVTMLAELSWLQQTLSK